MNDELKNRFMPVVREAMELFKEGLQTEASAQGHRQTGRGEQSMRIEVTETSNSIVGVIYAEGYMLVVDAGLTPEKIRYPIRVMIDYFRRHGLALKEATRAAWATRTIHQRTGMPTRGSYSYSQTGERKGFIKRGVERTLEKVKSVFEQKLSLEFDFSLTEQSAEVTTVVNF